MPKYLCKGKETHLHNSQQAAIDCHWCKKALRKRQQELWFNRDKEKEDGTDPSRK